jgi:hypothetical protein
MTALAEALKRAQDGALNALAKHYVNTDFEEIDLDQLRSDLDAIGCGDKVEQGQLIAAWSIVREHGGEVPKPAPPAVGRPDHEPASERQMSYIAKLADEKGTTAPDYQLTKESASEVISQLKAGTYNPDDWQVPF